MRCDLRDCLLAALLAVASWLMVLSDMEDITEDPKRSETTTGCHGTRSRLWTVANLYSTQPWHAFVSVARASIQTCMASDFVCATI